MKDDGILNCGGSPGRRYILISVGRLALGLEMKDEKKLRMIPRIGPK